MSKLFFQRERGNKKVIKTMIWKSFTDASFKDKAFLEDSLFNGDYVIINVAVPKNFIKNEKD